MSDRTKDALAAVAILVLLAVIAQRDLSLVSVKPLPDGRDECAHLKSAVIFQRILEESPAKFVKLLGGRKDGGYQDIVYPPLQPAVTAVVKSIVPYENDFTASAATNYLWWLAALLAIYAAGRRMSSTSGGLIAVLAFAAYPLVLRQMPVYSPYTLAAAPVAVSFWLLLRTEGFTKPGASALFGLSAVAAMLTYYTAALFLIGPALVVLIQGRANREPGSRAWPSVVIALGIVAGLALPYYTNPNFLGYFGKVVRLFFGQVTAAPGDFGLGETGEFGTVWHLFYYFIVLSTEQIGPALLIAFGIGAGVLAARSRGDSVLLLIACLLPLIALSFVGSKLVERTAPALPFFALATGVGLARIEKRWLRTAVFAPLVAAAVWTAEADYARLKTGLEHETKAGRTYHAQVERFESIARKGATIDIGCATFHTFYEYMRALTGIDGALWSAVHHKEFYERFDELEVVTYLSPPGSGETWFTRAYLEEKQAMRAFYRSVEFADSPIDTIVAAKDDFTLLGCDPIFGRDYCVWVRSDWWSPPPVK